MISEDEIKGGQIPLPVFATTYLKLSEPCDEAYEILRQRVSDLNGSVLSGPQDIKVKVVEFAQSVKGTYEDFKKWHEQ